MLLTSVALAINFFFIVFLLLNWNERRSDVDVIKLITATVLMTLEFSIGTYWLAALWVIVVILNATNIVSRSNY